VTEEETDKLLKLALVQQTVQYQEKLARQLAEAEQELAELRARRIEDMWLAELAELEPLLPSEELATTMPGLEGLKKGAGVDTADTKKKRKRKKASTDTNVVAAEGGGGEAKKAKKPRKPRVKKEATMGEAKKPPKKRKAE
jgi:hypothetical protein